MNYLHFSSGSPDASDHEDEVHQNIDNFTQTAFVYEVPALQNMCLQTISVHLCRYNEAITKTHDRNFQLNLNYLRQVHALFFLKKKLTKDNGIVKKKYWNIILNEYLKELNLNFIESKDWDDLVRKLDEIGHGIEKIYFDLSKTENLENAVFLSKMFY
ncbi:hypothetical protein TNCV_1818541 [Trichonephila clavipes]|nr:hypothetical protein TNCV_1818541 [Trichonephila clavipes]